MTVTGATRRLVGTQASYLRAVFVLVGSAIALSFGLLVATMTAVLDEAGVPLWAVVSIGVLLALVPLLLLGLIPASRRVEAVAVESLLGVHFRDGVPGPAVTWVQRRRTLWWFLLHVFTGALVVVAVTGLIALGQSWWTVPAAALTVFGTLLVGRALAAAAPALLGPSYAERLERLQADASRAAERGRIAREIHDSIGHALSLVTVQAVAARRVIDANPAFAREALETIETTTRRAVGDLDHMLGVLRDGSGGSAASNPTPGLDALDALLGAARSSGLAVESRVSGDLSRLPLLVSRESYRIVQEGLTNALKYSADSTATLNLAVGERSFDISLANRADARRSSRTGRGLRGIDERVGTLGGAATTRTDDDVWCLQVTLPLPEESP